ncbi:MAG: tetratricopeptide repeat protein, partial [Alphaproteobacteria bacterium]
MPHAAKLLHTATTHHQAGQLAEAEKAYQKLLRVEAANADALRLLGGLYLQTGRQAQAVEYLERAVRLLPKDAETLTNLGTGLRGLGRLDEAVLRYQQALAVRPTYLDALNNLGGLYHESGRASQALEIYGQVLRLEPESASAHFNYGNSLLAAGRGGEAIGRYEHALKLKPDYMEAMINLGMALSLAGKGEQSRQWLQIARSWFDKALKADPKNTTAMNNIGNVLRQQGKPEEAYSYYSEALRLRPDYMQAYINMASSLRDLGRLDEAIESCRAALRLQPDSTDARINLGASLQDMARHEEAIECFAEVLQLKPTSLDARWNTSLSLLALGRYEEGLPLHEVGLGVSHMRGDYPSAERRWNGEDITGKRLLIWCEQGFGDDLQFVRYAQLCKARGCVVIVLCPWPLRPLFRNCPFIDVLPESIEESDFDVHVPMMSLPYIFSTTVETIPAPIPYLFVSEAARAKWKDKFTDKNGFRVGLVWSGNPRENQLNANMIDKRRSMTLAILLPLFDVPDVQFYNLQIGAGVSQIDSCGLRDRMIDLMQEVKNFEDTAAIVEHLDLVISVDTSVVHLVGGMGKPVWVMSRFDA